jgi:hypothetical protein
MGGTRSVHNILDGNSERKKNLGDIDLDGKIKLKIKIFTCA